MMFTREVRQYALEHYEQDGWDYVVETMEDPEIDDIIKGAWTARRAINRMRRHVRLLDSIRKDIQGA